MLNLTPHKISIMGKDGKMIDFLPAGKEAGPEDERPDQATEKVTIRQDWKKFQSFFV